MENYQEIIEKSNDRSTPQEIKIKIMKQARFIFLYKYGQV